MTCLRHRKQSHSRWRFSEGRWFDQGGPGISLEVSLEVSGFSGVPLGGLWEASGALWGSVADLWRVSGAGLGRLLGSPGMPLRPPGAIAGTSRIPWPLLKSPQVCSGKDALVQ